MITCILWNMSLWSGTCKFLINIITFNTSEEVTATVFWGRKSVILLDVLGSWTISSHIYIKILTEFPESSKKRKHFICNMIMPGSISVWRIWIIFLWISRMRSYQYLPSNYCSHLSSSYYYYYNVSFFCALWPSSGSCASE